MVLASPSSAKIPAPTIAPTPMDTADQNPIGFFDLCILTLLLYQLRAKITPLSLIITRQINWLTIKYWDLNVMGSIVTSDLLI